MKVGLFVTCLIDMMRPEIGFSVLKLLEQAGYEVIVPETQTCCGQPAWNSGERPIARALAEKFLGEFESFDYVVIPSGSCGGMVKAHYHALLSDDAALQARFDALQPRIFELTDFLVNVANITQLDSQFAGNVTYHDSCSGLRELGVKQQPRTLLSLLPNVKVTEMKDCEACCGFGGTFSLKYGNISTAIVDEKCRNIAASEADAVVLGDLGCMLNMEGRMRRTGQACGVYHIAQVLAGDVESPAGQATSNSPRQS